MRSLHLLPLAFVAAASANTTLTFNGTIDASSPDHVGEAVTFTFVLSDNPLATRYAPGVFYDENTLTDVDLFSSISGTGITGAWARPSTLPDDAWSVVIRRSSAEPDPSVEIFASNESGSPIGLEFYGLAVYSIHLSAYFDSEPPTPTLKYDELFAGLSPSPALLLGGGFISTSGVFYEFTIDSLTISSGAIPEPSTYGLILGGLALAGAAVRRRKAAK